MMIDRATLAEVVRAAVTEAVAAVPLPVFRPGTITSVSGTTVSVRVDGDVSPVAAQVLGEIPPPGARVMVMFAPPSSVMVVGIIGAGGVPAGTIAWYGGTITGDVGSLSGAIQPPAGWVWCHGQSYQVVEFPTLFGAIMFTFGGSGTTFNVPDLRGRTVVAIDDMGGTDAGRSTIANTVGATQGVAWYGTDLAAMTLHAIIKT
jgi:hypothetical protein